MSALHKEPWLPIIPKLKPYNVLCASTRNVHIYNICTLTRRESVPLIHEIFIWHHCFWNEVCCALLKGYDYVVNIYMD